QREIARLRQDLQRQLDELDLAAQLPLLWQKRAYGQLQLSIVAILLQLAVTPLSLDDALADHARAAQHRYWQPIFEWMSHAQVIEHEELQGLRLLTDGLLVGQMYGALYDEPAREAFRQPWQDVVLENHTLACYRTVMLTANQLEIDISQWLKDKQSRLLARLAFLRQQGLQQKMYW
ncbi:MAG: adenylate cyclase, partial [Shewanella sp.]